MLVALRKESVDRNNRPNGKKHINSVALRKESVDRNFFDVSLNYKEVLSLSARRAWIEIFTTRTRTPIGCVALRKESVDRNRGCLLCSALDAVGRSPQGERG